MVYVQQQALNFTGSVTVGVMSATFLSITVESFIHYQNKFFMVFCNSPMEMYELCLTLLMLSYQLLECSLYNLFLFLFKYIQDLK
jgi:hypothetical protein